MIHENKRIIKNKLVLSQYEILKESYNHAIENFHVLYKGESMNKEALHNFVYNPQIEMFARFKMKSSFHKTKRII